MAVFLTYSLIGETDAVKVFPKLGTVLHTCDPKI